MNKSILPNERIAQKIILLRDEKVILDIQLGELYEIETRVLKQAVRRNRDRFPTDFMFELTEEEIDTMVSQNVIHGKQILGGAKPNAVTEVINPTTDFRNHATRQRIEYTAFNKTCRIDQFDVLEGEEHHDYTYGIEYGPDQARKISALFKDYRIYKTKHYVGDFEVEIDADGNRRELNYISGGDGLFAIYVNYYPSNETTAPADTMYYIHKDHLGSIYCITDESGNVVQNGVGNYQYFSYDPWGRQRNPFNWTFDKVSYHNLFDRGYTGHEHLTKFGLINMNGRTYDPWLGRMLQPDNYVQAAGYLQNYNRYSYCMNNPLIYTDSSGDLFDPITEFTIGFIKGLANGGNGFDEGWNQFANGYKIFAGLFAADTKQPGWGWQIFSRLTWQAPQTSIGYVFSDFSVTFGNIESVEYYAGATVTKSRYDRLFYNKSGLGITLGSYIIGANSIEANANNGLFQHEYGHYLQSIASGPAYIARYAIPSLFSKAEHKYDALADHVFNPVEQDANARSIKYFHNRNGENFKWKFKENPIGYPGTNWTMNDYNSENFQTLRKSLIIKPMIQDYFFPIISGIINTDYYNVNYINYEEIYYGHRH